MNKSFQTIINETGITADKVITRIQNAMLLIDDAPVAETTFQKWFGRDVDGANMSDWLNDVHELEYMARIVAGPGVEYTRLMPSLALLQLQISKEGQTFIM